MVRLEINVILVLVLVVAISVPAASTSSAEKPEDSGEIKTIKKKKNDDRSTSSSSGVRKEGSADQSLSMSASSASKGAEKAGLKRYAPKSSEERTGWRKWHRKCQRCFDDELKKWKDPSIKWICGAYQRARRSFKSLCSMHYRNCQDGTMFVKIRDHRCPNDTSREKFPHGDHFFYEYKVHLSDDSTEPDASDSEEEKEKSTEYSE